jgi:LmbE family N-acetylglucosaminyl deacetylase
MITTIDDVKQLGTILGVWAHPDDESFIAGGILAAAVRNGQAVVCVTATKGEAGTYDDSKWPPDQIAAIRSKELGAGLGILGVPNHFWLDYHDGDCDKVEAKEAQGKIKAYIQRYQPDTIVTFGADGWTGHPDHCTVAAWVTQVVKELDDKPAVYQAVVPQKLYNEQLKQADAKLDIFYNIEKPPITAQAQCDIYFKLTPELAKLKTAALKAMPSQTEKMFSLFDEKTINNMFATEAFVKAK